MERFMAVVMLAILAVFASCNKDDDGEDAAAPLVPPVQEECMQEAFADNEHTAGRGFSFTAASAWVATVTEVQAQTLMSGNSVAGTVAREGNNVVWLRLYLGDKEAYSGPAGTTTLRIELDQNYTGQRREATITIRSGNSSFTVTVVQEGIRQDGSENEAPVPVKSIHLSESELLLATGETAVLTATVTPDNATIKSVSWSSSNPQVADVHPVTGQITAVSAGTATVTAVSSSNKKVSASCAVTVSDGSSVPEPSNYAFVSRIERTVAYWTEMPVSQRCEENATYTFEYDDLGRVVSYTIDIIPNNNRSTATALVSNMDYSTPGRIRVEEKWSDTGTQTFDVLLNDKGYVWRCKSHPSSHNEWDNKLYTFEMTYNGEDRLSRIACSDFWNTYVYKNGVLSGGAYSDETGTGEEFGYEQYFNQIPNDKMNLDINILFFPGITSEAPEEAYVPGRIARLALLRLAGRSMDRYINFFAGWSSESVDGTASNYWTEPNVTIHESCDYFISDEDNDDYTLDYALNADGTVATVTARSTSIKIRHEYDIVVGDELVDPANPDMGYNYRIENEKDTEQGRGTNTITYKFVYR